MHPGPLPWCQIHTRFCPRIATATLRPRVPLHIARRTSRQVVTHTKTPCPQGHRSTSTRTAGSGLTVGIALSVVIISGFAYTQLKQSHQAPAPEQKSTLINDDLLIDLFGMPATIAPGRPGNLTAEQEDKLREMWSLLHRIFGIAQADGGEPATTAEHANGIPPPTRASTAADSIAPSEKKKKRFGVLRRNKDKKDDVSSDAASTYEQRPGTSAGTSSATINDILAHVDENDKHGQTKAFREALAQMSPEEIRRALWEMTKHDHPDGLLLRFLRARKWDVQAALVMMISAMRWRLMEARVDGDIMYEGEEGMVRASGGEDDAAVSMSDGHDFLDQMRLGKSFLHGLDKEGRPICIARARLHRKGEQSVASLERFTVYTIETTRMFLKPPVDTAMIIFDMTDFSVTKNMDWVPVNFMIKCFEANYPESLGAVLVHNAPWLFGRIWTIIKGLLDPVVASKIHFTSNVDDLAQFIDRSQIISELGGPARFEYAYVEPVAGENKCMADRATREALQSERAEIVREFEEKTRRWIEACGPGSAASGMDREAIAYERQKVAKRLRDSYWRLDPYVRARSLYDRTDMMKAFVGKPGEGGDPGYDGYDTDDGDEDEFVTAPGTPWKRSMDVRRSVDVGRVTNGKLG